MIGDLFEKVKKGIKETAEGVKETAEKVTVLTLIWIQTNKRKKETMMRPEVRNR